MSLHISGSVVYSRTVCVDLERYSSAKLQIGLVKQKKPTVTSLESSKQGDELVDAARTAAQRLWPCRKG